MSKKITAIAAAIRPQGPVVVKTEAAAMDEATSSGRKRPFVAINDEGKLVVCSRRTAAKYGWEAQGALFSRSSGSKKAQAPATPKGKKPAKVAPWDQKKDTKAAEPVATPAAAIRRIVRETARKELRSLFNEKG